MKTHITLNLEFAGVILPVQEHGGRSYVPLKPISDVFGLRWRQQKNKVKKDENQAIYETLGLPRGVAGAIKEHTFIPIENVFGYFFSINHAQVRAQGNDKGADFIIAKRKEWQNILLNYELAAGGMVKGVGAERALTMNKQKLYLATCRAAKQLDHNPDITALKDDLASELGYPVQQQLGEDVA